MRADHYGVAFPHAKGEYCFRKVFQHYLISCFSTPFLYEKDNELVKGEAEDILIMTPGTVVYHGPVESTEIFVNDWIYVWGDDLGQLLERYPLPLNTAFSIGNHNVVKNCIEKIRDEQLLKHFGFEEKINCTIIETIIDIYRLYQRMHHSVYESRLESAREIFMRHPEKDWTLSEMAALCGYSVSRFSALYVRHFGCSPKADIIAARMEQAKHMLHYSGFSVTEISEKCGFRSVYYFSKYFKETVGMPPTQYAHKHGIQLPISSTGL